MAHREWTERHIRELIKRELDKIKPTSTASLNAPIRNIDISAFYPETETGGYSISGLFMTNWYFYPVDSERMRVECPVLSPGKFLYEQVPNVYEYEGQRILGVMICPPVTNPPYFGCPLYYSQEHFDDLSKSGYDKFKNVHDPGYIVYKWSPFDDEGNLKDIVWVRLRTTSATADFRAGINLAEAYKVESRTESLVGMRLGYIVPGDNSITNWDLYDWNYSDYYYRLGVSNTICFAYFKSYAYAMYDNNIIIP